MKPPAVPPLERLIQLLQQVQKQKGMFVFPLDVASMENYLNGFRAASAACGFEIPRKLRQQVIESRGWKHAGAGPVPQMKDKGMAEEAMMDELIEIEIEQLRRWPQWPKKTQ